MNFSVLDYDHCSDDLKKT